MTRHDPSLLAVASIVALTLAIAACDDAATSVSENDTIGAHDAADGEDTASIGCQAGETRACPPGCADGLLQTCRADGTWDISACGAVRTFYEDADGDGVGNELAQQLACSLQPGLVDTAGDCDDTDRRLFPGASVFCGDGLDQDCSGADERCAQAGIGRIIDATSAILTGEENWGLGWSLACGDVTGDPLEELVAGAFGDDQRGSALVVTVSDIVLSTPAEPAAMRDSAVRVVGPDFGAYAGLAVGIARGLRGAASVDLLVAAPCAFRSDAVCGGGFGTIHGVGAETLSTAARGSTLDLAIDDARSVIVRGTTFADGAGHALAVGDLDGDGTADLVIGAPFADDVGVDSGRVYVVPGPLSDGELALDDPSVSVFEGGAGDARLGQAVLVADLDLDGINDLIVGSPATNDPEPFGQVAIVYGPISPRGDGMPRHLPDDADVLVETRAEGDFFGRALATVDNRSEDPVRRRLVVGAPSANVGPANAGTVYLFELPVPRASSRLELTTFDADYRLDGTQPDELVGFSLATARRFNGDEIDDLLVGAPGYKRSATRGEGAVHIVYGSELHWAPDAESDPISGNFNATLHGEADNDKLGWAVAVCDVDRDGFDDAIASAPLTTEMDLGSVYVVRGGERL